MNRERPSIGRIRLHRRPLFSVKSFRKSILLQHFYSANLRGKLSSEETRASRSSAGQNKCPPRVWGPSPLFWLEPIVGIVQNRREVEGLGSMIE